MRADVSLLGTASAEMMEAIEEGGAPERAGMDCAVTKVVTIAVVEMKDEGGGIMGAEVRVRNTNCSPFEVEGLLGTALRQIHAI